MQVMKTYEHQVNAAVELWFWIFRYVRGSLFILDYAEVLYLILNFISWNKEET